MAIPGSLAGISDLLQRHLEEYQQQLAATRGSQAALQAALDRLQAELAAAEAVLPGREALDASVRLVKLRDRLHALNKAVVEIEHRLQGMRSQLAQHAAAQRQAGGGGAGGGAGDAGSIGSGSGGGS